jgi:hypothetical protein
MKCHLLIGHSFLPIHKLAGLERQKKIKSLLGNIDLSLNCVTKFCFQWNLDEAISRSRIGFVSANGGRLSELRITVPSHHQFVQMGRESVRCMAGDRMEDVFGEVP